MAMRRLSVVAVAGLGLAGVVSSPVFSQEYPNRVIRFVVPAAAGGAGDIVARTVSGKLADLWKQQIVVDNKAGANTIIGTEFVAKSKPDGYTWLLGVQGSLAINPALYPKLPYDAVKDFDAITLLTVYGYVLAVHPSMPARNLQELIAHIRANSGKITYSTSGVGGSNHLAGELFRLTTNVDIVPVPYKGTSLALNGLIAGEVSMMFDTLITSIPQIKSGRVRPLAVSLANRSSSLPDIPTLAESGVPGYEFGAWQSIVAPSGTPKDIINKVYADTRKVLVLPDVRFKLVDQGANELVGSTPDELSKLIRSEIEKYRALVKRANIRLDQQP